MTRQSAAALVARYDHMLARAGTNRCDRIPSGSNPPTLSVCSEILMETQAREQGRGE